MTRDQLQLYIVRCIQEQALVDGISDRIVAQSFDREIHISATRDGEQSERVFYRLTLHARKR